LQQASTETQPFFMYLAFNAPHDPRQSPQSFVDRYPVDSIRLPESFLPEYPFKDKIGCGPGLRDEKLAPFPRTEFSVKVHRQEYYAIISHMDQQIGRILKAIEATGKAENTWIFFTADHGLAVGNHGLMGKQNLYDHSVRVPFIAVGPGVKAGARIDRPIYLQDVMPTTLELANTEKPAYVEFKSLLPNLLGGPGETPNQRPIYGAYLNLQRSIRTDQYKLIVYPQANRMRLYDMKKDPREMHDLLEDIATEDEATEDGELKGIAAELFEQLLSLQQEMGDHLDLRSIFPNA
jgi:arylsulfatase A-like enzyme